MMVGHFMTTKFPKRNSSCRNATTMKRDFCCWWRINFTNLPGSTLTKILHLLSSFCTTMWNDWNFFDRIARKRSMYLAVLCDGSKWCICSTFDIPENKIRIFLPFSIFTYFHILRYAIFVTDKNSINDLRLFCSNLKTFCFTKKMNNFIPHWAFHSYTT
jgi:hypothetical protein